ncbi:MAG: hypothetical protein KDE14_08470, partial [Rhodobacteraceae bacterium]|nr:hypothetical protein [Paracoccaceae bacterium]
MSSVMAVASRTPFVGLIAVTAVLFGLAIGHTTLVLMRHVLDADRSITGPEVALSAVLGCAGVWMVWYGRLRGEAVGTWLGFIAGTMIWIGFF